MFPSKIIHTHKISYLNIRSWKLHNESYITNGCKCQQVVHLSYLIRRLIAYHFIKWVVTKPVHVENFLKSHLASPNHFNFLEMKRIIDCYLFLNTFKTDKVEKICNQIIRWITEIFMTKKWVFFGYNGQHDLAIVGYWLP